MSAQVRWREEWGTAAPEAAIDPDRQLVDPHHHLWPDRAAGTTPAGPYLATDLVRDFASDPLWSPSRPERPIAIKPRPGSRRSARPSIAREAAVLATIPGAPRLAGIVAHADLRRGAGVETVLETHMEAGAGLLRGIRQMATHDPQGPNYPFPPGLYADPDFQEGARVVGAMGLVFDAWHFHSQQAEFLSLARACPDTVFVLDHHVTPLLTGGYAGRRDGVTAAWREGVREAARLPNVVVKASGFAMRETGAAWRDRPDPPSSEEIATAAAPQFEWLLEQFGPQRCMFASNFPVEKTAVGYAVLWNAFKKLAGRLSPDDADAVSRGTAVRVYRLDGAPDA